MCVYLDKYMYLEIYNYICIFANTCLNTHIYLDVYIKRFPSNRIDIDITLHKRRKWAWSTMPVILGLYSLSRKTSYSKISWSFETARFGFKLFQSLWNLAGTSAALLPRCLSNFRVIRPLQHPISRLRDVTRFGGKTSYRLVNRGPGARKWKHIFDNQV